MNNNNSIYSKLSYGLYSKADYRYITDNYVIHEYDLHHKDLPVYAYYDWLAERRSEREMKEYDVKEEFKDVKMTKEKILEILHYKKCKTMLRYVISLAEILKYATERDDKVHSINLSCVSATMLALYEYQVRASRVVSRCKDIFFLKEVDSFYVFKPKHSKVGMCKAYILNKEVQDLLMELKKELNIVPIRVRQLNKTVSKKDVDMEKVKQLQDKAVISSSLHIVNPCATREEFEKTLTYIIQCKYPQFAQMTAEASYVNSQQFYLEHPELQTRIKLSFKYSDSGILTSIGFRATNRNSLVQRQESRKEDKQED